MKKNNVFRIIWIVGIYVVLALILYLVVNYKVKWEDKDLNKYLYFYQCSNNICTSSIKVEDYYNRITCKNDICPYIKDINNNIVTLKDNNTEYLYNYISNYIIDNNYKTYKLSSDNNYIVTNNNNQYAVIDINGNIIIELTDIKIIDYKNEFITYEENGKYGINNINDNITIKPVYEDVILINSDMYAYLEDGNYYIVSYDTELPVNNDQYDYLYPINNCILTFKNKQINILNENLQSKLLMKINTYYEYRVEKERKSLSISSGENYIKFKVYTDENNYDYYIYDTKNSKLYS